MPARRGSLVLVLLAALAILAGTAATLLSSGRGTGGAAPTTAPTARPGAGVPRVGSDPRFSRFQEPSRAASVGVLVLRHPERTPVAGAKVVLHTGPGRIELTTDADGRASFSDALSGRVRIDVTAEGLEPRQRPAELLPGENPTVEVLLFESAPIEGRVVAAADGAPIAGARVVAWVDDGWGRIAPSEPLFPFSPAPPPAGAREAVTGDDGSFRLRAGRAGGVVGLETTAEGFAGETTHVSIGAGDSGPTSVEIRLARIGRVHGTVRDSRGRPIADAVVQAGPPGGRPTSRGPVRGLSGGDGAFVVEGLAVDAIHSVQAIGQKPGTPNPGFAVISDAVDVHLPADGRDATVDLVVRIPGTLIVDWADPSGRNDGAARCLAFPVDSPAGPVQAASNRVSGPAFTMRLAEGRWRVVIDSELHGAGEVEAVVVGDAEARVRVVVGTGPALEGVVVDDEGRPVPGVRVRAMRPGDAPGAETPDPNWSSSRVVTVQGSVLAVERFVPTSTAVAADALPGAPLRARTDEAGRFRLDAVRPGTSWLLYVREGNLTVEPAGPFEVPTRGIRLVARRSGAIQGRLFLPAGAAVPAARSIHFESETASTPAEPTLRTTGAFGDGSFRIEGLPPGKGRLWARSGTAYLDPVDVVVPSGEAADLGTLAMEPSHDLVGRVVTPTGTPSWDAQVAGGGADPARTGTDGSFVLRGLRSGEVDLVVIPPFHYPEAGARTTVRVTLPRTEGPIEIRLQHPGMVSGTARDASGRPLAGWRLLLRPASDPATPTTAVGSVSSRGTFEVKVAPGLWTLSLRGPGSRTDDASAQFEMTERGRTTVNFEVETK